jgi:hypothetical protein
LTASPRSSALRISSKFRLGQRRQILFSFLAYFGALHRAMQFGVQCGFEYGGIDVVVVNFAALPFKVHESGNAGLAGITQR